MPAAVLEEPAERVQETQFAALETNDNHEDEFQNESYSKSNKRNTLHNYGSVSVSSPPSAPLPSSHTATSGPQPSHPSHPSKPAAAARALAPDLLRGLLMVLQSIDHAAVSMTPWQHGIAVESEGDSKDVDTWNFPTAWTVRMLTHLCAPGFMFLLGMGIVYFGRSRAKLGWSTNQMAYHFAVRMLALILVNEFLGIIIARAQILVLNIVLLALAIDYFLAGIFWLALNASEQLVARLLALLPTFRPEDNEDAAVSQPLLDANSTQRQQKSSRAASVSWHLHNMVLFALAMVTIWWNIWLSPHHGRCESHTSSPDFPKLTVSHLGPWFDFWFYPIATRFVVSVFPPLAWISFAFLGILYGRIILARPWAASTINIGNVLAALGFALLFVATRLLHFGNLSEDCLHMPEHLAHPNRNQYLASFRSFFYIVKYPPSVAFFAFAMTINFLLLAFFGSLPPHIAKRIPTLMTFGTSALFFYVVHLILYGAIGMLVVSWFGYPLGRTNPVTGEPGYGVDLLPFWITWVIGIAILVPICGWYSRFKSSKGPNSLWRFF